MRLQKRRLVLATITTGVAVAGLAVAPTAIGAPTGGGLNQVKPTAQLTRQHVIVLLRNQHSGLRHDLGSGHNSARAQAIAADQTNVVSAAQHLGATHLHRYDVVNAFAATVRSDKVAQLSRVPGVSAVVPDLIIHGTEPTRDTGAGAAATPASAVPQSTYCSSNSSDPRLEPEALQTMHVAYDNPNTPSANQLEDGSGVTVGWIADGIDINNPDFIRANGDHVFVDYKDFSGDGLDAPTGANEAFGDASAIAAQGLHTYDVNSYAAAANQIPGGCFIRVQGVAPGASLVGLKVFGNSNSAPTSHFISAIQYAVDVAGVNVLNESFGADPYPDTMNDPVSLVNNAAIAAGVTVVSSTGDAGTNGTIGSPATSSQVIGVAGTTAFRSSVQTNVDGLSNPALKVKGWTNDNISSLSSGGYAQNGKVPDVAAPGEDGWALCTPDPSQYEGCTNIDGDAGAPIQDFGGTSWSSPLTAGTAALVIGAYRRAHNGANPSPATVKAVITGTAQDLGHPAFEQGAGEVDALAAVRAALSMPSPGTNTVPSTATGAQLVTTTNKTGVDQLNLAGRPNSVVSSTFRVQNASRGTQHVSLSTRSLTRVLSTRTGNVTLDPNQTFPNVTGDARAYKILNVNVPPGADRLDASIAWNGANDGFIVFLALVDPFGNFTAYSAPQGFGNFAHVDARFPAPGKWKAMVWANPAFTGNINYEFQSSKYTSFGNVSPSSLTLAPGQSATVHASFPTGKNAGDASAAVVMKTQRGEDASVPVSIRTMIPNAPNSTFTGVITGGNGRQFDALSKSYYLNVPKGKGAVSVSVKLDRPQYPNELFFGELVAPNGMTYSARSNFVFKGNNLDVGRVVVNNVRNPQAGRWRYLLFVATPTGGDVVNQPFTGTVRYPASGVRAAKPLPTSHTVLNRGQTYRFGVVLDNNSAQQRIYFADPRRNRLTTYRLASQVAGNNLQHLSLPNPEVTPNWLVPSETTSLNFRADASVPVGLDTFWTYGDPETFSGPSGNSASVTVSAQPSVPNGSWSSDIGEPGPFDGPAPSGHVAANLLARTPAFDPDADSSTGDFWLTSLVQPTSNATKNSAAGAAWHNLAAMRHQAKITPVRTVRAGAVPKCGNGPVILPAHASCSITFTITPSGPHGQVVRGHLSVQALDLFGPTTDDLASLPYAYKIK
jgi:hypothetical protein